jgi:Rhs element Vgr protein
MSELFIPNPSRHDVATYNILVNEKAIDPSYQILSISILKEINRIPLAKIILRDGEAAERDFEISNKEDFIPGKKIKIKIGFDGTNAQAFKGIIVKHAIRIRENGDTELRIECQDEAVKMTIGRKNQYFEKIKDSRLFDELIGKYSGLSGDTQSTSLEHKELVQHHISDWDFMLLRAEANAMLVNVNDGVVQIGKPKTSAAPVLQVSYGSSVLELEAEMDARTQWKNVEASSWDYANQQLFRADTSEASSFTQHGNIAGDELANTINLTKYQLHHSGHLPEQELQDWANGIMLRSRLSKIKGRAKVTGFSGIKPGDMVKLEGIGNRFKGKSFVTAVKQEIGNGVWDTHIQFGLDPRRYIFEHNDLNDAQSAGLVGAIHGLQIGKVVQLQNDPDGEDRILVRIPVIDNNAQGTWTRMASLDAGADRGTFFRPEIDDEVIVGFINDDPRDAVVLGMLHSSAKPAPIKAQDLNHEKGFTTRSKMHIHFNDDTKTITIDTPAGNKIMLDESATKIEITDQSSNKITMEPGGIKIESPVNIDIKAGAVLSLSAGGSLSISAPALSMKADASVSIEGATAKFASQGPNVISGLPVMIN